MFEKKGVVDLFLSRKFQEILTKSFLDQIPVPVAKCAYSVSIKEMCS